MDNSNDITIDGSIATWTMPRTESELGGTYTGTFQFRTFLSPTQQLQAGRQYRDYLGAHASMASDTEGNLAFALSQLSQRIIKAPPFWTSTSQDGGISGNIGDLIIISLVLDAAIRAENLFKQRIAEEREALLAKTIKAGEERVRKSTEE